MSLIQAQLLLHYGSLSPATADLPLSRSSPNFCPSLFCCFLNYQHAAERKGVYGCFFMLMRSAFKSLGKPWCLSRALEVSLSLLFAMERL